MKVAREARPHAAGHRWPYALIADFHDCPGANSGPAGIGWPEICSLRTFHETPLVPGSVPVDPHHDGVAAPRKMSF
jgi:hypothetical protein